MRKTSEPTPDRQRGSRSRTRISWKTSLETSTRDITTFPNLDPVVVAYEPVMMTANNNKQPRFFTRRLFGLPRDSRKLIDLARKTMVESRPKCLPPALPKPVLLACRQQLRGLPPVKMESVL